ncbi:unnamed protein product, partial [Ectocarpus sp. 12 AP-2014]
YQLLFPTPTALYTVFYEVAQNCVQDPDDNITALSPVVSRQFQVVLLCAPFSRRPEIANTSRNTFLDQFLSRCDQYSRVQSSPKTHSSGNVGQQQRSHHAHVLCTLLFESISTLGINETSARHEHVTWPYTGRWDNRHLVWQLKKQ